MQFSRQNSIQSSSEKYAPPNEEFIDTSSQPEARVFKPTGQTPQQQPVSTRPEQVRVNQLQLDINFPEHFGHPAHTEKVYIHRSRDVKDIYNRVRQILKADGRMPNEIKDIKLLYMNSIINEAHSLIEAGIDKNAKIIVIFEKADSFLPPNQAPILQERSSVQSYSDQASRNMLPKPPAVGYTTSPSYNEMESMTLRQLQTINNFTISNSEGSI